MVTVSQRVLGIENVFHKMLVAQKKVVAAIVQWIHLGLPSLGLGFEWRVNQLCFYQFIVTFYTVFVIAVWKGIN